MSDLELEPQELDDEQAQLLGALVLDVVDNDLDRAEATQLAGEAGIEERTLVAAVQTELRSRGSLVDVEPRDGDGDLQAAFDVEAFVKALPEGVVLCPHCIGMGAIVDTPPYDPTTHTCEVCKGHGRTRTGSLKTGADYERDCTACGGKGWQPNEPGVLGGPARPEDFDGELVPRDVDGRTPDDPDFDWTRVVPHAAPPEPIGEPEPLQV